MWPTRIISPPYPVSPIAYPPSRKTIVTNVRLIVVAAAASLPNNAREANESGASRVPTDGLQGIKTYPVTRVSWTWGGFKGCNLAFFVVRICFMFADPRYISRPIFQWDWMGNSEGGGNWGNYLRVFSGCDAKNTQTEKCLDYFCSWNRLRGRIFKNFKSWKLDSK